MTGTSARETSRPAKRQRPSATAHPGSVAPPVLFRLPSISQPACEDGHSAAAAMLSQGSLAIGASGSAAISYATAVQSAPPVVPTTPDSTAVSSASALASTLAQKKAASQRLLNTIILVLLLVALALISVLAFRGGQPAAKPGIAGSASPATERLDSLSDIRVPDLSQSPVDPSPSDQSARKGQNSSSSNAGSQNAASLSNDGIKSGGSTGAQLSLERPKSTGGAGTGLTMDAAQLAKKPDTRTAQVQLGAPVPMRDSGNSSLAASQDTSAPSAHSKSPLATPRYETVSTPSSSGSAPAAGANPGTGASPTLYDGATKPVAPTSDASSELKLSASADSEMSLIPSDYSSSAAKPTAAPSVASPSPATTSLATTTPAGASDSLGVTVGAGMTEPEFPKARATATPDLDVASLSSQFLEYSRQKNASPTSGSTEIVNRYAPAMPSAGSSAPATTVSNNPYAAGPSPSSQANAGVPYGTTGATLTPYVRSSPTSAVPSGLGTYPVASNAVSPGAAPTQSPYPTTQSAPATTVYPSLSAGTGYQQPSAPSGVPGSSAGYNANPSGGFAIPARGANTGSQPMATGSTQMGAYNYAAGQQYGYPAAASSAMTPPGGSATSPSAMTSTSPYPGGQAPQGMIGQSGFATAPSGDVVRAPVPVTGTMGYSTSPTR